MTDFIALALYICLSVFLLIVWPLMMHPTLPPRRKLFISIVSFLILVPAGLALYGWLGAPQLAATH